MRQFAFPFVTAAVIFIRAHATAQDFHPRVFDLAQLHGMTVPNMIRPTSAVFDPWRNLLYLHSSAFDHITIVEIHSGRLRPPIPLPDSLRGRLTLLHVHPVTGLVLTFLSESGTAKGGISVLDPVRGEMTPGFDPSPVSHPRCVSDALHDIVYMSTGRNIVLLLDGRTFLPFDSIDAGFPVSAIALDTIHAELYAAQHTPSGGIVHVRIFSTATQQMTRSYIYESDEGIEHISVDAISQSFALFTDGALRIHDALGFRLRDVPIPGGASCTASSDGSRRVFFLARRGFEQGGGAGRFGKLYRLAFPTSEVDSASVGIDPLALFTARSANELIVVNAGTADVEMFTIPDLRPSRSVAVGYSVEDAIITRDGRTLVIASPRGAGGSIHTVNIASQRVSTARAGGRPVHLAEDDGRGHVAALDQFSGTLYFLDDTLNVIGDSLRAEPVRACRTDADAALTIRGGTAAIALPEHATVALFPLDGSTVPHTERVDSQTQSGDSGPGFLQAVFTSDGSRLAVLSFRRRFLHVFPTLHPGQKLNVDLGTLDWQRIEPFWRSCLSTGIHEWDVFVGPYHIDCRTGNIDSIAVPGAIRVLGTDMAGYYLAVKMEADSLALLRSTTDYFSGATVHPLNGSLRDPDVIHFDPRHSTLLLGYSRTACVLLYTTDGTLPSTPPSSLLRAGTLYPNPALHGLCFVHAILENATPGETAEVILSDMLGRIVWNTTAQPNDGRIDIPISRLGPGVYRALIRTRWHLLNRYVVVLR
ncbi:MAG: hypothetical protein QHI48_00455 [Bacteroidota bacterium]|nr:hypothetical protein [Bacteroidota bacterium]